MENRYENATFTSREIAAIVFLDIYPHDVENWTDVGELNGNEYLTIEKPYAYCGYVVTEDEYDLLHESYLEEIYENWVQENNLSQFRHYLNREMVKKDLSTNVSIDETWIDAKKAAEWLKEMLDGEYINQAEYDYLLPIFQQMERCVVVFFE